MNIFSGEQTLVYLTTFFQFHRKKLFFVLKEWKLAEMKRVGFCVEELMSCGVLLDTEADVDQETENQCENHR